VLASEIAGGPREVLDYTAVQFEALLKNADFELAVAGNLRGDQGRIDLTFNRLSEIIGLARPNSE
jgi:hypothetical protein